MTHNDNTYSISNCFHYEAITRQHCISEGGVELTTQELLSLAIIDGDIDYAKFVIFKRLYTLREFITKKTKNVGFIFNPTTNQNISNNLQEYENYYDNWVEYYSSKNNLFTDDIEDVIEEVIKSKHWDVLYYIYFKEEDDLNSFLAREEDEFNEKKEKESVKNRKFFII